MPLINLKEQTTTTCNWQKSNKFVEAGRFYPLLAITKNNLNAFAEETLKLMDNFFKDVYHLKEIIEHE